MLFLSFADSFPADCVSLAVDGKAVAKCKCHETDLITLLNCGENRKSQS